MRKKILAIILIFLMILPTTIYAEETETESVSIESIEETSNLPSASIIDYLYEQNGGNVVISDMSINMALSMLLEGANGETQTQLEDYLGKTREENRKNNESILSGLSELENTTLEIANSLWYDDGLTEYGIKSEYINILEESYEASVEEADFSDPATADLINDWCLENTNGLIDEIVSSDTIANKSAVLANALYFLGTWIDPFPAATESTFYGFDEDITVDMMASQVDEYCENDYATAFIKYYYDDFAFVGILPKEEGDFNLADIDINGLLETKTDEYDVVIKMPKFTVEYSATLSDALKDIGLTDLFNSDADLSGISESLQVSEILHKTYISVDEEGTEAAAVTSVMVEMTAEMPDTETRQMFLNRPFAFAIIDSSDNILFLGKIVTL